MSLADDVRVLRLFAEGKGVSDVYGAIARVLPLLTKLGELSPEQARDIGEMLTDAAYDLDEDHAAPGLKAAYLRASTIFSRLLEDGP